MRRKTVLMVLRAALIAGLASAWLYSIFPIPVLIEKVLKEDILPSPEEGFVYHAWALGPLFLVINLLIWLPFSMVVVYLLHRKKILVRALGGAIMLAGVSTAVVACRVAVPVIGHCITEGNRVWEDFYLFFAFLPRVVLGAIAVLESYRMLKTP